MIGGSDEVAGLGTPSAAIGVTARTARICGVIEVARAEPRPPEVTHETKSRSSLDDRRRPVYPMLVRFEGEARAMISNDMQHKLGGQYFARTAC